MGSFRFAVIGDTHYCSLAGRPQTRRQQGLATLPDYLRYAGMKERVLDKLAAKLSALRPEFLVSTGDLIEGGADSEQDEAAALELLGAAVPKLHVAQGTHDRPKKQGQQSYYSFSHDGAVFFILDYRNWNQQQSSWFQHELGAAHKARRVFVFAHAPLYLWGRHFFDSPEFSRELRELFKQYPVDIFFCGHTHNQALSWHHGMLQIKCSSVGYPQQDVVPLERMHALAPEDGHNRFYWGIAEDSAPAFFSVDVDDERLQICWHSLRATASLRVPARFAQPEILSFPPQLPRNEQLSDWDFAQVRCGWLNIFSNIKQENNSQLFLNGRPLGEIPANSSYAARRAAPLSEEAISALQQSNQLRIRMPDSPIFAIGSISLELLLLDGRIIHSPVAADLFVCGESPDYAFAAHRAKRVAPKAEHSVTVAFTP
jgi:predicted phosphodiesterase